MDDKQKAPAYQWYVNEWRGSRAVHRMTWAQRGMYREMLDEQWDNGSLPDHPEAVAELLGGTPAEWLAAWPVLRRKFVDRRSRLRPGEVEVLPSDYDASRRIINLRLEKQRKEQRTYKAARSAAGRKGGLSNAKRFNVLDGKQSFSTALAEPKHSFSSEEAQLKPSSSSSSSSSSSTASTREKKDISSEPLAAHEPVDDSPTVLTFPTIGNHGPSWALTERQVAEWKGLFPSLDVAGEARKALAWVQAQPDRRKTARGMRKFLVAWFTRTVDRAMPPAGVHGSAKTAGNFAAAAAFASKGLR